MSMEYVRIGKLVELRQGLAINAQSRHLISKEETGLYLLRIADMASNSKCVNMSLTTPERYIATEKDIIYTRTGQVGLVFRNQTGVVHNNCFRVIPNNEDELCRDYLYWSLKSKSVYEYANLIAAGAAQPDLPHSSFKKIKIPFPKLETQQKIASILSTYDTLIENNTKRIQLLEKMAENLYKEWFVRFRFPGHENVPMENGLPKGWKIEKLGNVCDTIGGGTPSTSAPEYWGGSIKWVTPSDITSKKSLPLLNIEGRITDEGLKKSSAKLLPPYSILMTSRASIGYFGISPESVCTNQGFISIIPNEENMRMYILYSLKARKEEIIANANGSTFLEISKGRFRKMKIVVPSNTMLNSFEKKAQMLFNEVLNLELQNQSLTHQRDLLLPRLMSGKLEVNP